MNQYFHVENRRASKVQVITTTVKFFIYVTLFFWLLMASEYSFFTSLLYSAIIGLFASPISLIVGLVHHVTGTNEIQLGGIAGHLTIEFNGDVYILKFPKKHIYLNHYYVSFNPKMIKIRFPISMFYTYSHFPLTTPSPPADPSPPPASISPDMPSPPHLGRTPES